MRRLFQIVTGLALIVCLAWAYDKPGYDSIAAAIIALAAFIGLFLEERVSKKKQVDRKLLEDLKTALPSTGSIAFINEFNMAGFSFDPDELSDLYNFIYAWKGAEHEFLDKNLQKKLGNLHRLVSEYVQLIAYNTFPIGNANRQIVTTRMGRRTAGTIPTCSG